MKEKEVLRLNIRNRLKALDPGERRRRSQILAEKLWEIGAFRRSRCPFVFVSMDTEPDTHGIIRRCFNEEKRIAVPRVLRDRGALEIREIKTMDELFPGTLGILEPVPDRARLVELREIDFAVVPGLAFDRDNYRLGRGGGYYDRVIAELGPGVTKAALAFDFQLVDRVPREGHDRPVDLVLSA